MIHKDACQLISHCFMHESRCNRRIDTSGKGGNNFLVSNLFSDFLNLLINEVLHCPGSFRAAYIVDEVSQNFFSAFRMDDFRMKLDAVEFFIFIFIGGHRTSFRHSGYFKILRKLINVIGVAHPDNRIFVHIF